MDLDVMNSLVNDAQLEINGAKNKDELNSLKAKFLGKNSKFSEIQSSMKTIPNEEKAAFGKALNEVKSKITSLLMKNLKNLRKKKSIERLKVKQLILL